MILISIKNNKMAKQRYISSDFWLDPFIQELSSNEKLLYIYLFTNSHVDLCGIYEITVKTISFESGIGLESVSKALKSFTENNRVFYENGWIFLSNFRKHLKTNPNIKKGIKRSLDLIPIDILKAFESLSTGSTPVPNGTNLTEQPVLVLNENSTKECVSEKKSHTLEKEIEDLNKKRFGAFVKLSDQEEKMLRSKLNFDDSVFNEIIDDLNIAIGRADLTTVKSKFNNHYFSALSFIRYRNKKVHDPEAERLEKRKELQKKLDKLTQNK